LITVKGEYVTDDSPTATGRAPAVVRRLARAAAHSMAAAHGLVLRIATAQDRGHATALTKRAAALRTTERVPDRPDDPSVPQGDSHPCCRFEPARTTTRMRVA